MSTPELDFLLASQNSDGGWGYAQGQASTTEATATTALALQNDAAGDECYRRALDWLRTAQHPDGGWGLSHEDDESGWETAWVVLALTRVGDETGALDRGVNWLSAVKRLQITDDELQKETREKAGIDPNLDGWPWLPGEATWVEPTALAMLALGALPPTPAILARLNEAVRYQHDRRCRGGGWNFGNPIMLGGSLPPRAHPTAWAILALARVAPETIQPEDVTALRAEMQRDGGALALAWGLLALRTLDQNDEEAAARLSAQQRPDGGWNQNPYHTAVAILATQGHL